MSALALSLIVLPVSTSINGSPGQDSSRLSSTGQPVAPSGTAAGTRSYAGDALNEPLLAAAEDQRLIRVRAAAVAARLRGEKLLSPYRVSTGAPRTLVLTPRPSPYTAQDLTELAPGSFVHEADGSYLLSESIIVLAGADLSLGGPGGLTLHLESTPAGFVSIINDGGKLEISGTAGAPARVSSWDPSTGTTDTLTSDGRAYVRSIGGAMTISGARIESLGFWSGRTGGIAWTGTDRPTTAARTPALPPAAAPPKNGPPAPAPSDIRLLEADPGVLTDNYATGSIRDSTVTGNAFGIFTTKARDVEIRNVAVRNSLVDGIVLHRYVTNTRITDTTSSHNAGNGFVLARATARITLTNTGADFNGRSGIFMKGLPLAEGPSAGGDPGTVSSGHTVTGSRANGNDRYGIEVIGGRNVGLFANSITGNDRGIDLSRAVADAKIEGNRFENQRTRSISVTDGAPDTLVQSNTITGGTTAIYLRNTPGTVTRNTMTGLTFHGITINGNSSVQLHGNTISGTGPSALNLRESHGSVTRGGNDTQGWDKTAPFWSRVANFFQPLTVIWTLLGLILLLTAVTGRHARRQIVHPYAAQAPLSNFTTGQSPATIPRQQRRHAVSPGSASSPGARR
ncbi:right-handed parallel beta-helix repeat-containing protein [Arthrobacter sp. UYEF3]|uniref:right-handed parallel beta-helix repeat-containing protein n=1 Tax=Arthrobacter sp. UYEF3 TaxID=1756365 RepID=UPI0033942A67